MKKRSKKILKGIGFALLSIVLLSVIGFLIYVSDYYKADETATNLVKSHQSTIQIQGNLTVFSPLPEKNQNIGIIFYPGAKVEAIAYAPLMQGLADQGYTGVLVKMPFNLAFNLSAADKVIEKYPHIQTWFLSGHSLGGAMASSYLKNKETTPIKGLFLVGAYALSELKIPIKAVYGSEDLILSKDKILPWMHPYVIEGGNHGYFGNYGEQKGDGKASITALEQQKETIAEFEKFIQQNK